MVAAWEEVGLQNLSYRMVCVGSFTALERFCGDFAGRFKSPDDCNRLGNRGKEGTDTEGLFLPTLFPSRLQAQRCEPSPAARRLSETTLAMAVSLSKPDATGKSSQVHLHTRSGDETHDHHRRRRAPVRPLPETGRRQSKIVGAK